VIRTLGRTSLPGGERALPENGGSRQPLLSKSDTTAPALNWQVGFLSLLSATEARDFTRGIASGPTTAGKYPETTNATPRSGAFAKLAGSLASPFELHGG